MTDITSNKIAVYVKELEVKAARTNEEVLEPICPASSYLGSVHNFDDGDIDAAIAQHNRFFPRGPEWRDHLISLSGEFEAYLDKESKQYYQYERCSQADLDGVKMFDQLRAPSMTIRSLQEFRKNFDNFGGSVLKDLDWSNVGVAGGSVLACLTASQYEEVLRNSDIE
ncbi:hypothetical protein CF319_g5897 [Tilletia indica]|nr:hypothetical protein CF319_g5897 [Tilletia indica]